MAQAGDKLSEAKAMIGRLRSQHPAEAGALFDFMGEARGSALDERDKELINVALSVAARCEWATAFHAMQAARAGAGRAEIIEAGFMAVLMHGGPALAYLTPLIRAVDELFDD